MMALHACRSAASIAAFRAASARPIVVTITGTDLYRDLPSKPETARSLDIADRIVVLQEEAARALEPRWRAKTDVIFQSARPLPTQRKGNGRLDCVAVGHLRDEKDPRTIFRAFAELPAGLALRFRHIGAPLDEALGKAAFDLQSRDNRYRYLGALPHGLTRSALKAAHLLVHPSKMEGGANVVVEAITSGTPVLASRIPGNVGMLGADYSGYFEPGDAPGLARCIVQAAEEPEYLARLRRECAARRPLFIPTAESRAVRRLVASLVA